AALFEVEGDAGGAGVQGVLDEFLDDRGGAFDDLARGDLVGDEGGEGLDAGLGEGGHGGSVEDRRACAAYVTGRGWLSFLRTSKDSAHILGSMNHVQDPQGLARPVVHDHVVTDREETNVTKCPFRTLKAG